MARKKAPNGSGTQPRKRTDGRWEARVQTGIDPGTGKPIMKYIYGKTAAECSKKQRAITAEVDKGVYLEPSKMTISQWLNIWYDDYLGAVKPLTRASYHNYIENHLKPNLGATKLSALQPHTVQEFYNRSLKSELNPDGISAKSIKNMHGVLHKALNQAVMLGYIRTNPTDACVVPRTEKKEVAFIKSEDIQTFLNAIEGDPFERVFKTDLFTGLREGEILGLTWDCVDFEHGIVTISKQLQKDHFKGAQYHLVSCKTDRVRKIKPADFVMDTLRQQRKTQNANRLKAGNLWCNDWDLVFTNEVGEHLRISTVYNHFKRIVKKISLPDTRFHDMRHTYAMLSLQNGDDIKTVQQNVGHSTAAFTLDVYGHVSQKMQQESADRMQGFIEGLSKAT